jgi:hypothetical protein
VVVSGGKTPENGRKLETVIRVIISDAGILAVPARTDHNQENSDTGYDHRITASTFLPFSRVFPLEPARTLSPGFSIAVLTI